MKWTVITLLAGILSGMAASAPEKSSSPSPPSQGNRFLLVVDTSKAMARLPHAGRQAVFDLVFSGLENRMRPGDTFGVWTFQDEVSAGVFPIQVWEPENKLELASRVGKFLKEQKYKDKPVLDNALARVGALVRTIKDVNVILICSTEAQPKEGRPFAQMASLWQEKASESKKTKKPMILTLAMERGELVQRSIGVAGQPLDLPMPRPRLAATNAPAASATNLQARATRSNIIMQGPIRPKSEPAETVAVTNTAPAIASDSNSVAVAQVAPTPPSDGSQAKNADITPASAEPVRLLTSTPTVTWQEKPAPETKPSSGLLPAPIPVAAREKVASAAPPQQVATVTPAALSPTALILAGSGLMAVGLTVGAWLLISSRRGPQLSSISQSMSRVEQQRGA
jgi:hypothetical protein